MRCYLVKVKGCIRVAATGGESRAYRQAMVDDRGVKKGTVEISDLDIKTSKPQLLALINLLLETQDDNADFEFPTLEGEEDES